MAHSGFEFGACVQAPNTATLNPTVTGSSVIALKYQDGIIMVCDTLASYGRMARYKGVDRIAKFGTHTLMASSGEFSDFQQMCQYLEELDNEDFTNRESYSNALCLPHSHTHTHSLSAYMSRVCYQLRSKFNPLWCSFVICGYDDGSNNKGVSGKLRSRSKDKSGDDKNAKKDDPDSMDIEEISKMKHKSAYLSYVDMYGTIYEDDFICTGMARYIATTILRSKYRPDMSAEEAKELLTECMQLLYYRDTGASNKIQFATSTKDGVKVFDPFVFKSKWDYKDFILKTSEMPLAGCSW